METEDVLALMQQVAAEVVDPRFGALAAGDIAEKNPGDLVTVADQEAEVRITEALHAAYPDALVLGEEAASVDPGLLERFAHADHAFTVDPVDGTRNFVRGSPDHAMMLAELRAGEVVRSWIWQPQHERSYVAERGAGAWCGERRLVREAPTEELRGVTSRRGWIGKALGTLQALELTWVCCGIDYPQVVEGGADYAVYKKTLPWDHAPGSLLLHEAGGMVAGLDGAPYRPQEPAPQALVAAADAEVHDLVRGLLGSLPGL